MILTLITLAIIAAVYFSQSTNTLRQINTAARIRRGLITNVDIVTIFQQMYTKRHFTLIPYRAKNGLYRRLTVSCRYSLSSNGRLYRTILNSNGHTGIHFVSRYDAIQELIPYYRYSGRAFYSILGRYISDYTDEVEYLCNPHSQRPVFISQFIRPAAAII